VTLQSGYFSGVFAEIVLLVFRLYIGAVMLRFLLQRVRADFRFNPLARALVSITNPVLIPLRRLVPGYRGVDWAAILLMLLLAMLCWGILLALGGRVPNLPALLILAVAELMTIAVKLYFFAILLMVILSWVAPASYNPAVEVLGAVTDPLLRPARQLLPPIGGLDLSPILVLLLLHFTERLLIVPLQGYGLSLL
jgi:YggT family protein